MLLIFESLKKLYNSVEETPLWRTSALVAEITKPHDGCEKRVESYRVILYESAERGKRSLYA